MTLLRSSRFASKLLEYRFRREMLARDVGQMGLVIVLVMVCVAAFGVLDLLFYDDGNRNDLTLASRGLFLALSGPVLLVLRRGRDVRTFDMTVSLWVLLIAMELILISALRPGDYIAVPVLNILAVIAAYALVPLPLYILLVPVLTFSLVSCVLMLSVTSSELERWELAVLASYLIANGFGAYMSWRLNRNRRQEYVLLRQERASRSMLERAMKQVKVLQGIIPICSYCKRIRNDDGYYEAVEEYVSRCSEADFSHTLCPECLQEHYPDDCGDRPAC